MKYLLAVLTCVAVVVAYLLIGAAVFGWEHGGGVIPMIILFAAVGAIWRKMTQRITNDTASDINGAESTAGAHSSEEAIRQRILRSEQQAKWLAIALLMVALIAVVIARFSNTTVATRADNGDVYIFGPPEGKSGFEPLLLLHRRDLSTPSSRLVGHWEGHGILYYRPIDDALGYGTFAWLDFDGRFKIDGELKILSESRSGKYLKTREFLTENGKTQCIVAEYCIAEDGQSMTKEAISENGSRYLFNYHYVDSLIPVTLK
jgi:hypothetical protein